MARYPAVSSLDTAVPNFRPSPSLSNLRQLLLKRLSHLPNGLSCFVLACRISKVPCLLLALPKEVFRRQSLGATNSSISTMTTHHTSIGQGGPYCNPFALAGWRLAGLLARWLASLLACLPVCQLASLHPCMSEDKLSKQMGNHTVRRGHWCVLG